MKPMKHTVAGINFAIGAVILLIGTLYYASVFWGNYSDYREVMDTREEFLSGDFEGASASLEALYDRTGRPTHGAAAAYAFYRKGNLGKSLTIYKKLLKAAEDKTDKAFFEANCMALSLTQESMTKKDMKAAITRLSEQLTAERGDLHTQIGCLYFMLENFTKAKEHFDKATKSGAITGYENLRTAYMGLVLSAFGNKSYSEGLKWQKTLEIYQGKTSNNAFLAKVFKCFLFKENSDEKSKGGLLSSIVNTREGLGSDKDAGFINHFLGTGSLAQGKYDEAAAYYLKSFNASPNDAVALNFSHSMMKHGEALRAKGADMKAFAKSTEVFIKLAESKSIKEETQNEILRLAAEVYAMAGQDDDAMEMLRRVARRMPSNPLVWYLQAGIHLNHKDYKQAMGSLKKAVKLGDVSEEVKALDKGLSRGVSITVRVPRKGYLSKNTDLLQVDLFNHSPAEILKSEVFCTFDGRDIGFDLLGETILINLPKKLTSGQHRIKVQIKDIVGNVNVVEKVVTVDTWIPRAKLLSPAMGAELAPGKAELICELSDQGAGIKLDSLQVVIRGRFSAELGIDTDKAFVSSGIGLEGVNVSEEKIKISKKVLKSLKPGTYYIKITGVDFAGNRLMKNSTFVITGNSTTKKGGK